MSFFKDLLNAGIDASDAQTLEAHYANEPEFIDGLEMIARAMALNQPVGLIPPAGEPWKLLHMGMVHSSDPQSAFMAAIGAMAADLQVAISGAVSTRMAQLAQFAQAHAAALPGKHRKTADYIRVLKNLGYEFRLNMVTQAVEVNGKKITNSLRKTIRGQVRDLLIREVGVVEDAYEAEAFKNRYHPIRNYLTDLKFDGGDPIGDVAAHFTSEYGMFPTWLRRWMVGACAKVMQAEENRMMVLDGPQNIGKSHFVRWLASPLEEYFIEGGIDTGSEEVYRRMGQRWIWEVSELGATTRKSDWEALKAFITMRTVTVRIKYDRDDTDMPSLASLFGTINNEEGFLPVNDRRFYVERVTNIDWNYKKIDVDQLWAQAFDLYLAGEPWEPQGDERDVVTQINNDYRMLDMVEETLKSLFEINTQEFSWQLSSLDIMETLKAYGLKVPGELDARRLSRALTKLGLEKPKLMRIGNKSQRGYFGIRKRVP